jgi:beta-lactamase superfamily II metal-dependent hydrolase
VESKSLCVHVLNVGDGDGIVIQFPEVDGSRKYAVVDCYKSSKMLPYLKKLNADMKLEFVCATHPHYDHIKGIPKLLDEYKGRIAEFWDSGFRHTTLTYDRMMGKIENDPGTSFMRVTSGMERYINGVKVSVLAPSIYLRNRYDTWGVNINNASVVLKLEYLDPGADPEVTKPSVVILGGDAQFDSWAKVLEEYPHHEKTTNPDQRIKMEKSFNPLNCQALKVAHHGSKHGTALEYVEILDPEHAVVSCSDSSRYGFPHEIALLSILDETQKIYFTDYDDDEWQKKGTTIVIGNGTNYLDFDFIGEGRSDPANPPQAYCD